MLTRWRGTDIDIAPSDMVVSVRGPQDRIDRTGQIIGQRFRIDALIGTGAMAHVFRAVDTQTAAYVALKILKTSLESDPAARQRFSRGYFSRARTTCVPAASRTPR